MVQSLLTRRIIIVILTPQLDKTRDAIYKAGGVSFLIGLVNSKEVSIQSRALDILQELSSIGNFLNNIILGN